MIPRLLTIWDQIRSSLWAMPLAMIIVACALAYGALHISIEIGDDPTWFLFSGSASQAPQFLSNLVSAMITMATLAISITMVVLTLAAQQLGPRLIRNFMATGEHKPRSDCSSPPWSIYCWCCAALMAPPTRSPILRSPLALASVLLSVVTLLLFVHHLARSIIADNVIDRVGAAARRTILDACCRPRPLNKRDRPPDIKKESAPVVFDPRRLCPGHRLHRDRARRPESRRIGSSYDIRAGQHVGAGAAVLGFISPRIAAREPLTAAIQSARA